MSILKQKTLKKEINLSGVGLHSGNDVNIKLVPQRPNTGIYFKRTDLVSNNIIYPSVFNVSSASYCTKISNEHGVSVSTIEHLMAALYGKGIDNLLIEIDAEEVPILDGSSKNFVEAVDSAGFEISDQPIKIITIDKEIRSINYNIDTVNRHLYLMGVATSASELKRVFAYARSVRHVRKIVSYVRVKNRYNDKRSP